MIHPTPSELLARIADALTDTVLPELEREEARIQLQVAALILRRLAGPAGDIVPYLDADSRDIAKTVEVWLLQLPLGDLAAKTELVHETLEREPVPTIAELLARYERLQALLVDVEEANRRLPPDDARRSELDADLRALLVRMLTRERQIHTTYSTW